MLDSVRDDMAGRAYPLGRWPQWELRVTGETVHLAIDLTVIDGRSIHFLLRELFRLYGDATATPREPAPIEEYLTEQAGLRSAPEYASWSRHWQERFRDMPPGPSLGAPPSRRVRLEGRVPRWDRFEEAARAGGVEPDHLLLAVLTETLSARFEDPFTVSVVRWTPESEPYRPGELTALSWVTHRERELPPLERALAYRRVIEADARADAVSGLGELRKLVMKERRTRSFAFPVVYTSILDLSDLPLPPGVAGGPWMTYTPDVALDCIAIKEGDELRYYWDAIESDFPDSLDDVFARYESALHRLCGSTADGTATNRDAAKRDTTETAVDRDAARTAAGRDTAGTAIDRDTAGTMVDQDTAGTATGRDTAGTAVDRDTILYAWNDTATEFPDRDPVHLLFERHAAERPDAVALRFPSGVMTYGELNREANQIAWRLKRMGVGPETMVGIRMRRGPSMVAAVFGVLKAGGAYLPLEPSLPRDRAHLMMADAAATTLLTCTGTSGWDPPGDVRVVEVDRQPEDAREEWTTDPEPVTTPDNTAYVIFTSGSTGKPKGVAVAHRAVLNLLNWCYRTFGFDESDVGLCVTSLGFDLSVFDILGLLGRGASLYIADETQQRDPDLLLDILLSEPVTFWNSAPTTLNQMAPLFAERAGQPGTGNLRLVFLSGDYTPLPLPGAVRALFPDAEIVSLGGATEATVWSNYFPIGDIDPAWRSIPYGRPIDNARYHILGEDLEPCAVGVEGDLYIAGECLSLGYYNQPELTEERFVPDPFAGEPGGRMYRTGDRASYFPDGNMCFLGRADTQVKIRGFRVELGEIEHRLRGHPGVQDAVVVTRDDHTGERKVVAYVVPATGSSPPPSAEELRAHAAETLPDYMVPNYVGSVATFPATANGKLDRDALPWPVDRAPDEPAERSDTERFGAGGPLAGAPASDGRSGSGQLGSGQSGGERSGAEETDRNATEATDLAAVERFVEEISGLFGEMLGQNDLDPTRDLWDQGATSFTMVQVSKALQKRHGQRIPVSALLDDPTIRGIASYVVAALPDAAPAVLPQGAGEQRTDGRQGDGQQTDGREDRQEGSRRREGGRQGDGRQADGRRDDRGRANRREDSRRGDERQREDGWREAEKRENGQRENLRHEDGRREDGRRETDEPGPVEFFSPEERARFKEARWNLRRVEPDASLIRLDRIDVASEHFAWRSSHRTFGPGPIPYRALCRLLNLLRETPVEGRERFLYPSAGDTYSVQAYLHLRSGAVEGVAGGVYYYNPHEHALQLVNDRPEIERTVHFRYNQPIFDEAGFSLYLIGQMKGIEALYGEDSERYLTLEAGYLGQLLMTGQAACGIGLCPIGDVAFDRIRDQLALDDGHLFLQGFLGGPAEHPERAASTGERPMFSPEAGAVQPDDGETGGSRLLTGSGNEAGAVRADGGEAGGIAVSRGFREGGGSRTGGWGRGRRGRRRDGRALSGCGRS